MRDERIVSMGADIDRLKKEVQVCRCFIDVCSAETETAILFSSAAFLIELF